MYGQCTRIHSYIQTVAPRGRGRGLITPGAYPMSPDLHHEPGPTPWARAYTMSPDLHHEPGPTPWARTYTMSPDLHHEPGPTPWARTYTMSPDLHHEPGPTPWARTYTMSPDLHHEPGPTPWARAYTMSPDLHHEPGPTPWDLHHEPGPTPWARTYTMRARAYTMSPDPTPWARAQIFPPLMLSVRWLKGVWFFCHAYSSGPLISLTKVTHDNWHWCLWISCCRFNIYIGFKIYIGPNIIHSLYICIRIFVVHIMVIGRGPGVRWNMYSRQWNIYSPCRPTYFIMT